MACWLNKDEQILWQGRKSKVCFGSCIFWAMIFGFTYELPGLLRLLMCVSGVLLFRSIMISFARFCGERYILTNQRLICKTGFFFRQTYSCFLNRCQQFNSRQSLLGYWLNYGTLTLGNMDHQPWFAENIGNFKQCVQCITTQLALDHSIMATQSTDTSCV